MEVEELDLADVITKTYLAIEKVLNNNIKVILDLEKDLKIKGNFSFGISLRAGRYNLFLTGRPFPLRIRSSRPTAPGPGSS